MQFWYSESVLRGFTSVDGVITQHIGSSQHQNGHLFNAAGGVLGMPRRREGGGDPRDPGFQAKQIDQIISKL